MSMYERFVKRGFDVILSVMLLPLLMPLCFIVGCAIWLEDRGPVFYLGLRLGRHGVPFRMLKFRSMRVNAPDWRLEDGSTYNAEDDPRQTRVGRFLRKTSIDELPQLMNILVGQMSFVGPRPDPVDWLDRYTASDRTLLNVRPGITGYNQAYYRNSTNGREKTNNDVYYAENVSFGLDTKIIAATFLSVIRRTNVYNVACTPSQASVGSANETRQ